MVRKIIHIDRDKCNGCGLCVDACHEGAIGLVEGKAALLREDYCDGLGDCLPVCPVGAIRFEERQAAPYDQAAVDRNKARQAAHGEAREGANDGARGGEPGETLPCGCPGRNVRAIRREDAPLSGRDAASAGGGESQLSQWPVQIKLAPVNAPYFQGASLLVAADCVAYAYGDFHNRLLKNRVVLIGCPKLDGVDYAEKLTQILRQNDIKRVLVARMEVPCCGGMVQAVKTALQNSGKMIPWDIVTISVDGKILDA